MSKRGLFYVGGIQSLVATRVFRKKENPVPQWRSGGQDPWVPLDSRRGNESYFRFLITQEFDIKRT